MKSENVYGLVVSFLVYRFARLAVAPLVSHKIKTYFTSYQLPFSKALSTFAACFKPSLSFC